jgi:hypothetical protein
MARFDINRPITTREPTVPVDAGLPIGRHLFRLEVIDRLGRRSTPNDAIVEVQRIVVDPRPPVPPLPPPIDPTRPVIITRSAVSPSPRRRRGRTKKEKP